jgi:hypothetical protein
MPVLNCFCRDTIYRVRTMEATHLLFGNLFPPTTRLYRTEKSVIDSCFPAAADPIPVSTHLSNKILSLSVIQPSLSDLRFCLFSVSVRSLPLGFGSIFSLGFSWKRSIREWYFPIATNAAERHSCLIAAPRSPVSAEDASFAKAAAAPGLPAVLVSIQRRFPCFPPSRIGSLCRSSATLLCSRRSLRRQFSPFRCWCANPPGGTLLRLIC